jgi:hypothetical protein
MLPRDSVSDIRRTISGGRDSQFNLVDAPKASFAGKDDTKAPRVLREVVISLRPLVQGW